MENKTDMTYRQAQTAGYKMHHSAFRRGYVSRKVDTDTLPVYYIDNPKSRYNGMYFVDLPNHSSTQYCTRQYMTGK